MRSIKARFNKIQNKYPSLGACIILAQAVRGQRFTQSSIAREFSKLIPKDEFDKKERTAVLKFLVEVTNTPEDDKIMKKNATGKEVEV